MRYMVALVALLGVLHCQGGVLRTDHVTTTFSGIEDRWARALTETLEAARSVYVGDLGFDMPDAIRFRIKCDTKLKTQLYTNGQDSVYLGLSTPDQLAKPAVSGYFHLYGMCHELGHMAMYRILKRRDWLDNQALEAWAHYAGSLVVDRVYEMKGADLWPDAYDYRVDGSARLQKEITSSPSGPAAAWSTLGDIIGKRGFPEQFRRWQKLDVDRTNPLAALRTPALAQFWEQFGGVILDRLALSPFPKASARPDELTGKMTILAPDDGSAEDQGSLGGSAHGRFFTATGLRQYLKSVSLFGARYGDDPSLRFDIALCDSDYRIVAVWSEPYAAFDKGEMKWVKMNVTPTRVLDKFYLVLDFHATASNGVYAGIDRSSRGDSVKGLAGKSPEPLTDGDWMIRAELEQ